MVVPGWVIVNTGIEMNADERLKQREQISALADGQLDDLEFAAALELTGADGDARACWRVYHLVGDVLRSGELAAVGRDRDFLARLSTRLRAEPVSPEADRSSLKSPEWIAVGEQKRTVPMPIGEASPQAANDSSMRWKLVAGFASIAAVAAISFNAIGTLDGLGSGARLARLDKLPASPVPPVFTVAGSQTLAEESVMIRDRQLDELMSAHRQFGGTSALQNPAGFLRNATFEGSGR
jgi:sigma-E factor negative regulatory protein RseA